MGHVGWLFGIVSILARFKNIFYVLVILSPYYIEMLLEKIINVDLLFGTAYVYPWF